METGCGSRSIPVLNENRRGLLGIGKNKVMGNFFFFVRSEQHCKSNCTILDRSERLECLK